MTGKELLNECTGFEWDRNNIDKNWEKHKVTPFESEQVFFNRPLWVADDVKHTEKESRFYALGKTDSDRFLFIAFTIRDKKIRVISSRDMNKKAKSSMKRKTLKKIPKFRNENEERAFWSAHDSSEYINWDRAERATLSKLKPSSKTISIRLPKGLLEELKLIANRRDVPYQSLMKIFLAERIEEELNK